MEKSVQDSEGGRYAARESTKFAEPEDDNIAVFQSGLIQLSIMVRF